MNINGNAALAWKVDGREASLKSDLSCRSERAQRRSTDSTRQFIAIFIVMSLICDPRLDLGCVNSPVEKSYFVLRK